MTTLFDILYGVGRELPGSWYEGVADSGTSDALKFADEDIGGADDVWNRGTALILKTTDGLAPQGESRVIDDYDAKGNASGDGLVTVETAFSVAVDAADQIGLIKKRYTRSQIVGRINQALLHVPLWETTDTDATTVSSDKLYTLPTNYTPQNLLQVWVAGDTDNTTWVPIFHFTPFTYPDGTHKIEFADYFVNARAIRYVREYYHSRVSADSDTIDARIDSEMLTWMSIVNVIRWRYNRYSNAPEQITNALNAALQIESRLKAAHMPLLPPRFPRLPSQIQWQEGQRPGYPPVT